MTLHTKTLVGVALNLAFATHAIFEGAASGSDAPYRCIRQTHGLASGCPGHSLYTTIIYLIVLTTAERQTRFLPPPQDEARDGEEADANEEPAIPMLGSMLTLFQFQSSVLKLWLTHLVFCSKKELSRSTMTLCAWNSVACQRLSGASCRS